MKASIVDGAFKRFDLDNDGQISWQETALLSHMALEGLGHNIPGSKAAAIVDGGVYTLFDRFDTDRGGLSVAEFRGALKEMLFPMQSPAQWFGAADKNSDSSLSFDELKVAMRDELRSSGGSAGPFDPAEGIYTVIGEMGADFVMTGLGQSKRGGVSKETFVDAMAEIHGTEQPSPEPAQP